MSASKYYDVEFTSVIHIGVIADSEEQAQYLAERVKDASDCEDEFGVNAEVTCCDEIDEDEYDCFTLKEEEL